MKTKLNIKSLVCALLLVVTSCSNETSVTPKASQVLDLNNFTFSEVASLLQQGKSVVLKDGESKIFVSKFEVVKNAVLSDGDQPVDLYEVSGNDSVTATLCANFVSIRVGKLGDKLGYVSYANADDQQTVVAQYNSQSQKTKSLISAIDSADSKKSFKINVTLAQKNYLASLQNQNIVFSGNDIVKVTPEMLTKANSNRAKVAATSTVDSYVFPRNKVVTIYLLMNDKYTNGNCAPISWEVTWAQQDAVKSIADVFRDDKANAPTLVFKSQTCDFKSTQKASVDIDNFSAYVEANPTKYPTAEKDIFFFVRNAIWASFTDGAAGISYACSYDINSKNNSCAYGLAATSSWLCTQVLAHELGHIFGIDGHSTTPWYRLNYDLMNAQAHIYTTSYHRTDINQKSQFRNAIYNSLKQK